MILEKIHFLLLPIGFELGVDSKTIAQSGVEILQHMKLGSHQQISLQQLQ